MQDTRSCCHRLNIKGIGTPKRLHGEAFGIYEYHSMSNGHNVYKHIDDEFYLYFSSGNHWMVSKKNWSPIPTKPAIMLHFHLFRRFTVSFNISKK